MRWLETFHTHSPSFLLWWSFRKMKRDALKEPNKFLVAFHPGGGTVTHVTKSYRNGDDFFYGRAGQVTCSQVFRIPLTFTERGRMWWCIPIDCLRMFHLIINQIHVTDLGILSQVIVASNWEFWGLFFWLLCNKNVTWVVQVIAQPMWSLWNLQGMVIKFLCW